MDSTSSMGQYTSTARISEIHTSQGLQQLWSKSMVGAEVDSDARKYSPRCHPGTRTTIRGRIVGWVHGKRDRHWWMFWVMGPAGVGKSAVAQTVAEKLNKEGRLGASLFFSRPDGRDDPKQVIPTLVYQLAVRIRQYKHLVTQRLAEDPSLLEKAPRIQFKELIIEPFRLIMTQQPSIISEPFLILVDGLDECRCQDSQCELIDMINEHVGTFKIFPLLWVIFSKPEWYLKHLLSQPDFPVACEREELRIDDSEAQQDVHQFLRSEFKQISRRFPHYIDLPWPPETILHLLATTASGLFALAATLTRFVGDKYARDPCGRLRICVRFLGGHGTPGSINPLHALDLLYHQICTTIPSHALATTKQILGLSIWYPCIPGASRLSARGVAIFLNLDKGEFYRSLDQLHSVIDIPDPSDADLGHLRFYHASFQDYLKDRHRSREFAIDETRIHYDAASKGAQRHNDHDQSATEALVLWGTNDRERLEGLISSLQAYIPYVILEACPKLGGDDASSIAGMLETFNFRALDKYKDKLPEFVLWLYSLLQPERLVHIQTEQCYLIHFFPSTFVRRPELELERFRRTFLKIANVDIPSKHFVFHLGAQPKEQRITLILTGHPDGPTSPLDQPVDVSRATPPKKASTPMSKMEMSPVPRTTVSTGSGMGSGPPGPKPYSYVTRLHHVLRRSGSGEEKEISYVESYVGPEHAPTWTVKAKGKCIISSTPWDKDSEFRYPVKGEVKGVGTGTSKGKAREEASRNALVAMGFDPYPESLT
ncbi:hypothetical protein NP233_g6780 [Leucocoprinus birnbaumii]|uniref:Nephrocystin 3-like N-terminal domain-containing protein n=1 Tax=Leucocoprinus birnbaumii TaxID=56174 RepID=A0AAD5VQE8_9AGAR|nr:hypothetical protein NP233_g6780 [Leucocoprinus birnbaumii]